MSLPVDKSTTSFMGSKSYSKLQWPPYTSRMQRDIYNRTLSRGFTPEEVAFFIDKKQWVKGQFVEIRKPDAE